MTAAPMTALPEPRFIRGEADVRALPDGTYWCLREHNAAWFAMELFESYWWFEIADPSEYPASHMVNGWISGPLPQLQVPERFPTPTGRPE